MKLWTPEECGRKRIQARRRKDIPRCACGCGRIAYWPLGSETPVFHTRLCGYQMALRIVRGGLGAD